MIALDKIAASFLLGAAGDTLGAPIEGVKSLDDILAQYGQGGLDRIVEFKNAYDTGRDFPAGRITDDTTMAMATVSALLLHDRINGMTPALRRSLWQAWLQWGRHQDGGEALVSNIDQRIKWHEGAELFWFYCGAGSGTMAALMQDHPGSIAAPLQYDCVVRGKQVKGPNEGCGGMMRVAPLAFLPLAPEQIFELACESAAITHGHPDAYVATGAVALMIHFAGHDDDYLARTRELLEKFARRAEYKNGAASCLAAIDLAMGEKKGEMRVMDALPQELGYARAYLAIPVLAQVVYALLAHPEKHRAKEALVLAVNHSGDSDSVAAIVGNILGARHGTACLPRDLLDAVIQKEDISRMAEKLHARFGRLKNKG